MTSSIDTLVLERPDGADYTLRFAPGNVEVLYQGSEISDSLRCGFVPQKRENVDELESRIKSMEAYLQSRRRLRIPSEIQKDFEEKYGSKVCDYLETGIELKMQGAAAMFDPAAGRAGKVLIPPPNRFCTGGKTINTLFGFSYGDTEQDTWEHELIHAAMRENPCMLKMKRWDYGILALMDTFYLPLPYSPLDKVTSFIESAPLTFLPEQHPLVKKYAKSSFEMQVPWGVMSLLLAGALALKESGLLTALPAAHWLASTAVRIPRVKRMRKQIPDDIAQMTSVKERLGPAEALKLLAFMDRDMLKETVDYLEQEDIRF